MWVNFDFLCESGYRGSACAFVAVGASDREIRIACFRTAHELGFHNVQSVTIDQ